MSSLSSPLHGAPVGHWEAHPALFLIAVLLALAPPFGFGAERPTPAAVPDLDLDQLVNIEFTSAAKKEQKLSEVAAAAHVLTHDDIQRSGVTSIPEALRLVPGLDAARVDSHNWAITSRGFNDVFANKLLVMIDGRSVYTPLFSGVNWDVQDTMLEDIDRIEVIRGPGGTLWGANAVNGVINIITKSAKQTQGALVSAGGGSEEQGFSSARYGGQLGSNAWFRVYGKYFNRDDSVLLNGDRANDAWWMGRGGMRLDWEPNGQDKLTLQGDYYNGKEQQTTTFPLLTPPFTQAQNTPIDVSGGNVLTRWTRAWSDRSELQFQAYYDYTKRDAGYYREDRRTFDLDAQQRFSLGDRHDIVWGLGYRRAVDEIPESTLALDFNPDSRADNLYSGFVQDEISLVRDRLRLTLGTKLEHNDYSGWEVQPGARLSWTPVEHHSFWASVARAVRTPSRADSDISLTTSVIPGAPSTAVSFVGNRAAGSENLIAYELGYRVQPLARLSLDATAFYNNYQDLRSFRAGTPYIAVTPAPPHAVLPLAFVNDLTGETYGVELTARLRLTDWWRWQARYSYLEMQLHAKSGSGADEGAEGESPHHQFGLQSSMDLPGHVQFDVGLRYVDNLPTLRIPSYVEMDARLAWRPTKNVELSIVGQNLLKSSHLEYRPSSINIQQTEVQRGVFGKITFSF